MDASRHGLAQDHWRRPAHVDGITDDEVMGMSAGGGVAGMAAIVSEPWRRLRTAKPEREVRRKPSGAVAAPPTPFPWDDAMAIGFGLYSFQTWTMTPREFARAVSVLEPKRSVPPARGALEALMRAFPDTR